jgi:hypothetical protein
MTRTPSVAELQAALLAARGGQFASASAGSPRAEPAQLPSPAGGHPEDRQRPAAAGPAGGAETIGVVGSYPGVGASTVAVALADAAALRGYATALAEMAPPGSSSLITAADSDLASLDDGWLRARRGSVLIARLARPCAAAELPPPSPAAARVQVWDMGSSWPEASTDASPPSPRLLVGRASVSGLRRMELLMERSALAPAAVALVGPRRWPRALSASVGPSIAALDAAGRVVRVPVDRRLEVTGLTPDPLPKAINEAGRALLDLLLSSADRRP